MIQKRISTDVMTLAEVADYLRVPENTVELLVAQEEIPARRVGQQWRFSRAALEEWLRTSNPRDRMLAQAGAFAHDKDLAKLLAHVEKQRRRGKPGKG